MLRGKPVSSMQVLLCIADSGDEHGAMDRDDDLVRLKRKAICCLSGKPVVLCRTGNLASMSKYLRWEKGTIMFTVVRLLSIIDNVPHLGINGSNLFIDATAAHVFNAYFTTYCDHVASVSAKAPFSMDNSWTPKRRRKALSDDGQSQSELTPMSVQGTPVKFTTP